MNTFIGKQILLGVTGGIAAYKSAELTRLLRREGAVVQVVMTRSAMAFVSPLTFQALSGKPVYRKLLDPNDEAAMGHIRLARSADLILIAPATANFIAKLHSGLADDLLSTLCLAADVPVIVAPAMNRAMWEKPVTQENIAGLQRRGVRILGPAEGSQACGENGPGRMIEPLEILAALTKMFNHGALSGLTVLISAGPTREPIDPVRYLSNRSSGKMGYALAAAANSAGAQVILVSGPTSLPDPKVHELILVETADQMYDQVIQKAEVADIYIGAAAVADYSPVVVAQQKIKKQHDEILLTLRKTRDILASVSALDQRPFTVGFAAETDRLEDYAREKMRAKSLDMIAGNWVGQGALGFEGDDNALWVCWPGGEIDLPKAPKQQLAQQLIALIAEHYHAQNSMNR